MRGHVGFKIPREPLPAARITQLTTDALVVPFEEDNGARITQLCVDMLHNSATTSQPGARITQITVDFLANSNE